MSPPKFVGRDDEEEGPDQQDVTKIKKTKIGNGGKSKSALRDAEEESTLAPGVLRAASSQRGSKGLSAISNKSSRSQTPTPAEPITNSTNSLAYLEKLQSAQYAARQLIQGQVEKDAAREDFISLETGGTAKDAFYSESNEEGFATTQVILDLDGDGDGGIEQANVETALGSTMDLDQDEDDDEETTAWEYDLISKGTAQTIPDPVLRNQLSEARIPGSFNQSLPTLEGSIQRLESQLANTILKKAETQTELEGYRESQRMLDEKKVSLKEALRAATENYAHAESQLKASRG